MRLRGRKEKAGPTNGCKLECAYRKALQRSSVTWFCVQHRQAGQGSRIWTNYCSNNTWLPRFPPHHALMPMHVQGIQSPSCYARFPFRCQPATTCNWPEPPPLPIRKSNPALTQSREPMRAAPLAACSIVSDRMIPHLTLWLSPQGAVPLELPGPILKIAGWDITSSHSFLPCIFNIVHPLQISWRLAFARSRYARIEVSICLLGLVFTSCLNQLSFRRCDLHYMHGGTEY